MPSQFTYKNKVWALFGCAAVLLGTYLFLIGNTVYNTLNRQRAEQSISALTAELSQTEFAYLAKEASITAELAGSMGFVEADNIMIAKSSREEQTLAFAR